ncbi:MAG: hypothetical protein ABIV25_10130 [Paracoccaceae bacterium]
MKFWKSHRFATTGFLLATAVTLFFLVRMASTAIYWANPAHHNETVKPWMTAGYIARSWHVDPRILDLLGGLPGPKDHGPWTIKQAADARGVEVSVVIAQVNKALAIIKAQGDRR